MSGTRKADGPADPSRPFGVSKAIVAATVAGNALEFFDFVTYAFFAVYIGKAFFPASTPFLSLLLSVTVFGVGFIFRPLGAFLIGRFADRAGRKPAMLLTIAMITLGTLGLAATPTYASIGIAAPLIVVFCRLVQGLALGGDVGPASAFLIEIAPPGQRGLYSSWQIASQGASTATAGLVGLTLSLVLSPADLAAWGWRVPFVIGLLLLPVAFYLRRSMPETLEQRPQADRSEPARLRRHVRVMVLAVLIILGGTVTTYVANYMTTYAITVLKLSPSISLAATLMAGLGTFSCALIGGWLSDRVGRRPVMLLPRVAIAILIYPLFLLVSSHPTPVTLFAVTIAITALTSSSAAASLAVIPELLPQGIRAGGLAISYAVGVSLFGGTTQLVITYLIGVTGNPTSPAWYVSLANIISVGAMLLLPETRDRPLLGHGAAILHAVDAKPG